MAHLRDRRAFGNIGTRKFRGARFGDALSPRFSGILDQYPGAAAAYSLKALSAAWLDQPVIRANRVADNTDLEVTAAQITDGTLVAFSQGGDVTVKFLYDQSGSATTHHLFSDTSTKRRLIVDTGVLVTEGGEPAMAGSIYHYNIGGGGIDLTGDFSILYLANVNSNAGLLGGTNNAPRLRSLGTIMEVVNSANTEINFGDLDLTPTNHTYDGTRVLTGIYRDSSLNMDVTIAGQVAATGSQVLSGGFNFTQIFARAADADPMTGKFQEMIAWNRDIR